MWSFIMYMYTFNPLSHSPNVHNVRQVVLEGVGVVGVAGGCGYILSLGGSEQVASLGEDVAEGGEEEGEEERE